MWDKKSFKTSPLDTGCKLNIHKNAEETMDIFWTSYVHSIYVLYPAGSVIQLKEP